ncbi:hypothetical protein SAMN03159294_2926 [Kosakonia radicincitans]|nr:hypothetical protein SAMN03159294_2926 [Kosakonia radicincitans]
MGCTARWLFLVLTLSARLQIPLANNFNNRPVYRREALHFIAPDGIHKLVCLLQQP